MNEKLAVEYGAEFISEFFLYALGSGLLLWEYTRSARKEEKKEAILQATRERIEDQLSRLQNESTESVFVIEQQGAEIRSLQRQVGNLHTEIEKLKTSINGNS